MPGDYSRKIFRNRKHYSGVLMQQGRVQLDADWNEQLDIQLHRTEAESIDVIGRCGVPRNNSGFKIGSTPDGQDLTISAGRIYVDGLLCELEEATTYISQPHLPNPEQTTVGAEPTRLNLTTGRYVVYLDAWQLERTALDDRLIREVALGGPDTTTRIQNVWQVRLLPVSETRPPNGGPAESVTCKTPFIEFEEATAASTGTLKAQTAPPKPEEDPCLLPPTSGYSLLENQLYRVEIQTGGTLTPAGGPVTFKWSRDNASVGTTVVSIADATATVTEIGKDELLSFASGQWVEIVDEESTLKARPQVLVQIDKVQRATREITFKTSLAPFANLTGLKLRRWDQANDANENGLQATTGVWIDIEAGVQVQFSEGTYHAGDYWLIPARTLTREIEWPPFEIPNTQPLPQPPLGVRHHFCRLALLEVNDGALELHDCRTTFPPLTELLNFFHVGGTGQEGAPGVRLPCPLEVGVTNGNLPVPGARVRFVVGPGAGVLHSATGSGSEVIVETNERGVAQCAWELGRDQQRQQCIRVEATLFDEEDKPFAPALHFNASLSNARDEERGITVREIIATSDGKPLLNDSLVSVSRLQSGVTIVCDQKIAPNAGGGLKPPSPFPENIAGKPTCFITLDLPYPIGGDTELWDSSDIVGFQPLILAGQLSIKEERMLWSPSSDANRWLQGRLFPALVRIADRVLAHLTIKGNFIFAEESPSLNLDGDVFGRPKEENRIDVGLPSGDSRRGGDLEMWFWLSHQEIIGRNLTIRVDANTIVGTLLDNAGAVVPNATVRLSGPIEDRTTTTGAQGRFKFVDLPRGTYVISVLGADEQTVTIS